MDKFSKEYMELENKYLGEKLLREKLRTENQKKQDVIKVLEEQKEILKNTIEAMYSDQLAVDRLNGEWLLKARKLMCKLRDTP